MQAGLYAAAGQVFDPVWTAFGCGGLVLKNAVGKEGLGCEGEVEGVADEGVVCVAECALDVCVAVAESYEGFGTSPVE